MKNSNKIVEVYMSRCLSCNNTFYEFSYSELEECPHCENILINGNVDVESTVNAHIQIDYKTGEIREI